VAKSLTLRAVFLEFSFALFDSRVIAIGFLAGEMEIAFNALVFCWDPAIRYLAAVAVAEPDY
jgi:hypothetical protein